MKNNILEISEDDFDDIIIELEDIDKILTERISDLHQIKGTLRGIEDSKERINKNIIAKQLYNKLLSILTPLNLYL